MFSVMQSCGVQARGGLLYEYAISNTARVAGHVASSDSAELLRASYTEHHHDAEIHPCRPCKADGGLFIPRLNLLRRKQRPCWAAAGFNVCDGLAGTEWYSPATSSRNTSCLIHNPPRETVGQQADSGENYRNGTSRCEGRGSLLQRDLVRPQP